MLKKALWGVVCLAFALAFGVVVGIFHPAEQVNALWIVVAAACFYAITYRFYSAFIAARILSLDNANATPAIRLRDGVDYHPTNRIVLFGHHFAAIAGAGPLIGPMLAAQFGYLPGFLWILLGSALAGAVHDMVVLGASVRKDGKSLAQIAKDEVGPVGGVAASVAILFIIVIALAGLGLSVVNALTHSAWGTFTIAATIPIALFMGLYLYKLRPGKIAETSVIGVALLLCAVFAGHYIPGSALERVFSLPRETLVICMASYGLIASILPVWMLLCPRDYLSTYMKLGTIALLAIGIVLIAPVLSMPPVTAFVAGGGPVIPGKVFPFMFITIACGAISGFHALISSGTTPKMLTAEKDVRMIGYGAMIAEGFVSMIALIAACILVPGDYFAINSMLTPDKLAALGFPVSRVQELSGMVGVNVANRPGGAVSLAVGMASILGGLPGMKGLMAYWYNFALMFEAMFILTTIDTGTRVARFLIQEFGGYVYKPLNQRNWKPGIVASSALVVLAWGYLIWSGNISTIWPMFGISNQLLSAIALGVGTTWIIKQGKLKYAWVTMIPMAFLTVTTLTASYQQYFIFMNSYAAASDSSKATTFLVDAILVAIMAALTVVAIGNMLYKWFKLIRVPETKIEPALGGK
jgi:carbon starvation protein